ncbi:MAG: hypothetical protein RLZZ504_1127, partial [Bacteroidota bacterium]
VGCCFNFGKEILINPAEQADDVVDQQENHPKQFRDDHGKGDGRHQFHHGGRQGHELESYQQKENKGENGIAPIAVFQNAFGALTPMGCDGFNTLPNVGVECEKKEGKKNETSNLLFEHGL